MASWFSMPGNVLLRRFGRLCTASAQLCDRGAPPVRSALVEDFSELNLIKKPLGSLVLPQSIPFSLLASQGRKENRIFSFHLKLSQGGGCSAPSQVMRQGRCLVPHKTQDGSI